MYGIVLKPELPESIGDLFFLLISGFPRGDEIIRL
jgi:hypothetical protein